MKSIKHITIGFWAINILLGIGIVAYAATAFIAKRDDPLARVAEIGRADPDETQTPEYSRNTASMQRMGVLEDKVIESTAKVSVDLSKYIAIKSTHKNWIFAEIVTAKDQQATIFLEDDMYGALRGKVEGLPEEVRGWKLAEIKGSTAVFTKGSEKQELKVGENVGVSTGDPSIDAMRGKAYNAGDYKTQQTMTGANRQAWMMDPEEIKWALANQDAVMNSEVTFGQAQGGLRLTWVKPGSIAATRGFAANDVVMAVNGIVVDSPEAVRKLRDHPSFQNPSVISVKVNRAGQDVYLTYSIPRPPK